MLSIHADYEHQCQCQCQSWIYIAHKRKASNALTSVGQREFNVSKAYPKRHRCPLGSRSDIPFIVSWLIGLNDVT